MDAKYNHHMIVLGREARGWTQQDLAVALGCKRPTVAKWESGQRTPSPRDIDALSRALGFTEEFFAEGNRVLALGGDFLYRSRVRVPAPAKRRVEACCNIRRMQVSRLLAAADWRTEFQVPSIPAEARSKQIKWIAEDVRAAWKMRPGRIENLTALVESAGAIVFLVDFGTDAIDGTNLCTPGLPPLLFVNQDVSGERYRWNLAHELGHAIMHSATVRGDPEAEANAFANEFLMPRRQISSDLNNLDLARAAELKQYWGVSMAALIRRARDLGKINAGKYRRLFTALSADGQRVREQFPLEQEVPTAFDQLAKFHRDKLGMTQEEFDALMYTPSLEALPTPTMQVPRIAGYDDDPHPKLFLTN